MDPALREHNTENLIVRGVTGAAGVSVSAISPVVNEKNDVAPEI